MAIVKLLVVTFWAHSHLTNQGKLKWTIVEELRLVTAKHIYIVKQDGNLRLPIVELFFVTS